jgi:hypothetical protein
MRDPGDRPKFAAVYWTYPVQWAGFDALSGDADEAAGRSRTVRYQRDLVRAHVAAEGGDLVREFVHLEIGPDRPSDSIEDVMGEAVELCRSRHVALLYVDFAAAQGWRDHTHMRRTIDRHDLRSEGLHPDPLTVDGETFDPIAHFRRSREIDLAFRHRRALDAEEALLVAADLHPPGYGRYPRIAKHLNSLSIPTHSGREWTGDNVRMALTKVGSAGASRPHLG